MQKKIEYPQWQAPKTEAPPKLREQHWAWLCDPNSLTQRLRQHFGTKIEFRLLSVGYDTALPDECDYLESQSEDRHWVRRIGWYYQNTLWVAARTVIPEHHLQPLLRNMGNISIGNYLFESGYYQRGTLEVAPLTANYDLTPFHPTPTPTANTTWGRRSLFYGKKDKLLVSEVFLPEFFDAILV